MLAHLLPVSLPPFGLVQFIYCLPSLGVLSLGRVASELGTSGTGGISKSGVVELFCQNRTSSTAESARISGESLSI